MQGMFDWNDVRVFLEVHRAGSLTAAGKRLGADPSTVGRRIAALEKSLGANLFFRTPDGHVATPAGERLVARAERIEDEALAVGRELAGEEEQLSGTIRITGPATFSVRVLVPLLAAFRRRWPDIDVQLAADDRVLSLTKREADMAVRVNRPRDPGLVVRRLADFGHGLYASRGYIAEHGMPKPDWEGHLAIGFDDGIAPADRRWFDEHMKKARVVFTSNSTPGQVAAAVEGIGLALLPAYLAASESELVCVLPPAKALMESVWLVLHKDLRHSAKVRACADFLSAEIAKLNPWLAGTKGARRPA
jgi:DNA-binding transcriptional LysR family regulator